MKLSIFVLVLTAGGFSLSSAQPLDAPYHETDSYTARKMLKMADTGPGDVVYDLGSGAVGIELDPELVQKSIKNAEVAGVSDRVTFIKGDLFKADLSSATVVTLYLLQATNLRLRPKLLKELRPGARVVSNTFDMGD